MFDVVIANGTLVDGTGATAYRADVGVADDRIAAIGDLSESDAGRVIDASGLVVAPGFVDTHTHSEGALLVDPQHANGLRQGITTELLGIDGMSYAPLSPGNYLMYRRWLGGLLGEPPADLDMSTVAAFRQHYDRRVAVNTAYLVPHGTIRLEAAGFRDVPLVRTAHGPRETARPAGHRARCVGTLRRVELLPGPLEHNRGDRGVVHDGPGRRRGLHVRASACATGESLRRRRCQRGARDRAPVGSTAPSGALPHR